VTGTLTAPRAAALLVALRLRRLRNRMFSRKAKAAAPGAPRAATPTRGRGFWLPLLLALYLPFFAFQTSVLTVTELARHDGHAAAGDEPPRKEDRLARALLPRALADAAVARAIAPVVAAELTALMIAVLLISMASRELTAPEWDLEWLVTLPLPRRTLLGVRILERTLVNPPALLVIGMFTVAVAWMRGRGLAGAALVGAACALPLMVVVAAAWVLTETFLRLRLSQPRLRNAQALLTVLAIAIFFVTLRSSAQSVGLVVRAGRALGDAWRWTPPGLAYLGLTAPAGQAVRAVAALASEAFLAVSLTLLLLERLLRHGIVTGGAREGGGRGVAAPPAPAAAPARAPALARLSPVQRRELLLLARDRNFLIQTLFMPLFIVGIQVYVGARGLKIGSFEPSSVFAAGFAVAAYSLMFSAFQIVNAEGQALWLLFTLPRRPEKVLLEKVKLWGGVALIYPLAVVVLFFATHAPSLRAVALALVALAGVPIFALTAAAFGILSWDPAVAAVHQRRLRPAFVYLYMSLAAAYTYAIATGGLQQRGTLMLLTGLVGAALWQKGRDQLPYVLDLSAAPPSRVSIADGLIAALLFFVLQAVVALSQGPQAVTVPLLYKSFIWAGGLTFLAVRFVHWRTRAVGVPAFFGARAARALALGVGGAVVAALLGAGYLLVARHFALLPHEPVKDVRLAALAMAPLAVAAAPVFEEYIFRGLLFGGLRRSVSPSVAALASAAIFAVVHPPMAVVPVFLMALVAASVYARAGILLAPVIVHAGYNAAIVAMQALWIR
jgi:membrane protease YdiL (CAAX protease family)